MEQKDICCPEFNPAEWDNKIIDWDNKKFIKGKVCTLFYMPLNFGCVIKKLMKKVDSAGAESTDWMGLSDHTSKWNMDIYVAVDKEIPDADNVSLSGKHLFKVYEGSYNETGKWCKDFDEYANRENINIEKQYMWYTTCPKCAKKYGKNYVVIVGKVN